MSNEQSGPTGNFEGPHAQSFQIQVTNAPFFGTGPGTAYVGINGKGWCYLTSDPGAASSFTAATDGDKKYITTPNGWLSYAGATPYYVGSYTGGITYQTYIEGGILHLHRGVMSFYSDGTNTWLYNQSENTLGYTPCTVLPATAP